MGVFRYWLIEINLSSVVVNLTEQDETKHAHIIATGPTSHYQSSSTELVSAVDLSLSGAAEALNLPESEEPGFAVFVLPPWWSNPEGRLLPEHKREVDQICKQMQLTGLGYTAYDEAFVEQRNSDPTNKLQNYLLLYIDNAELTLSQVFMGKVIKHSHQAYTDNFLESVESILLSIKDTSALPPQIFLAGNLSPDQYDALSSFNWQNKRLPDVFLQLPSLKKISESEFKTAILEFIAQHISVPSSVQPSPPSTPVVTSPIPDPPAPEVITLTEVVEEPVAKTSLSDTDAHTLGFSYISHNPKSYQPFVPQIEESSTTYPRKPHQKLKLPTLKFSLPKLKMPFVFGTVLLLVILLAASFYFNSGELHLVLTSVPFEKTYPVTLDKNSSQVDWAKKIIPVVQKTAQAQATATVTATGTKKTGEYSKGEVIIFNTSSKTQTIPKNTVLKDKNGTKFLIQNTTTVDAAKQNFDQGVITMGQTRSTIQASEIGESGNIPKDESLTFQDPAIGSSLAVKVRDTLTGGFSKDVTIVSKSDRDKLDQQLSQALKDKVDTTIKQQLSDPNLLSDTLKQLKSKTEVNRQVGEEATELNGTITSSISVLSVEKNVKQSLTTNLLSSEPQLADLNITPDTFDLVFKVENSTTDSAKGTLKISGKGQSKIATDTLINSLLGKSVGSIRPIINNFAPRTYQYNYYPKNILPLWNNFLPSVSSHLKITTEARSL